MPTNYIPCEYLPDHFEQVEYVACLDATWHALEMSAIEGMMIDDSFTEYSA